MHDFSQQLAELSPAKRALLLRRLQEKSVAVPQGGIPRRSDPTTYPLSSAQQRLWLLEQMQPDSALYNITMPLEISSVLETAALHKAIVRCLSTIIMRHEALRATFVAENGVPVQRVLPPQPVDVPVIDLSALAADEREAEARRVLNAEAHRPFDLSRGPLLRALLVRLEADRLVLLLGVHHIAFDAWSVGVLMREMATLFTRMAMGLQPVLPPLPLQYADFAAWQQQSLQGALLERQMSYWKAQLADMPPPLDLPISQQRPLVRTFAGARHRFAVPAEVIAALHEISQAERATLFMTLLAAWKLLLHRYTAQHDIVVGSPIANRTRSEVENLIGFFVNTLVLRTDLGGDPSFRELIQRVRAMTLGAYAHQDLPFEMLVEELQPERNLSYTPLFQVMFVLQNVPLPTSGNTGADITLLPDLDGPAQFDLTLSLMESDGGLQGALEYNSDLFDAAHIARMATHFTTLLAAVAANPVACVSRLPLLTAAEWQHVVEVNNTAAPFPAHESAHALFAAQAARTPDAVAIRAHSGELTYHELNGRADQLAHLLRSLGVGAETRVGLCLDRSAEMVVGLLGILKAGGAYVPIDPAYPRERLALLFEDSQVEILVTRRSLAEQLPAGQRTLVFLDDWATIASAAATGPLPAVPPDNLAYVIYTSGSTGKPKGVLLQHRGLCNLALDYARTMHVEPGSRVLQFFSFGFDGAVAEIFISLLSGATLCIPSSEVPLTGSNLINVLRDEAITTAILPPAVLAVVSPEELPALHTVGSAGDACTGDIVARWGAGRRFFNVYGPTEATVAATLFEVEGDWSDATSVPVGRPLANGEMYVLDAQMQPLPVGVPGDIYLGGVQLARGYLDQPALTAEKFVPHPFTTRPGARLYKTGDRGRLRADGTLEFCERNDNQVKVRGFRVELGEIEAVLRQHPQVREAVVVAQEDGIGSKRLVAYVVEEPRTKNQEPGGENEGTNEQTNQGAPRAENHESGGENEGTNEQRNNVPVDQEVGSQFSVLGSSVGSQFSVLSSSALRAFLQTRLPAYMLPAVCQTVDTLPLTPNGKVDRRALAARRVTLSASRATAAPVEPQSELEQRIVTIWQDVLGLAGVGVDDNFFDLGGNSLSVIKLQNLLHTTAGREVPTLTLFQYPTIRSLADHLSAPAAPAPAASSAPDRAQKQKESLQRQRMRARR